jgi:hypothetical protein
MQKDSLFKWKPKLSKISVLTSDKIDLKYKKKQTMAGEQGHHIIIKGLIYHGGGTIQNLYG